MYLLQLDKIIKEIKMLGKNDHPLKDTQSVAKDRGPEVNADLIMKRVDEPE